MAELTTTLVHSQVSPQLAALLYPLGGWVLKRFFSRLSVRGLEHLPRSGPIILAPTHRARWDALVVPYVAGRLTTGRDLRFMVSHDEMLGFQGWVISQFGGFPVNTRQPSIAALRHGVELLTAGEALVIFPEGNIFRESQVQPLRPGLARLAIQATLARGQADLQILPMSIHYSQPVPTWGSEIDVEFAPPLQIRDYPYRSGKRAAIALTTDLQAALANLAGTASTPPQLLEV